MGTALEKVTVNLPTLGTIVVVMVTLGVGGLWFSIDRVQGAVEMGLKRHSGAANPHPTLTAEIADAVPQEVYEVRMLAVEARMVELEAKTKRIERIQTAAYMEQREDLAVIRAAVGAAPATGREPMSIILQPDVTRTTVP